MLTLSQRLDALTAALTAAPPPAGGPAHRIASDYGPSGDSKKGGGRHVASKAGVKRYGLPIGTPLGQTGSRRKGDAKTQVSYNTFMAASTPADQRKAASWMSSDDLKRAGEALFSFNSKNERDQSARIALVKELADRGIDPHSVGYKGGPVVLNPNPKQDPTVKAAQHKQSVADRAKRAQAAAKAKADRAKVQAQHARDQANLAAQRAQTKADQAKKQASKDATTAAQQRARQALAQAIAEGAITETEARRRMAELKTVGG